MVTPLGLREKRRKAIEARTETLRKVTGQNKESDRKKEINERTPKN